MSKLLLLEIEVNAEGNKLAYLGIKGEGGYRMAGPKAWGGSRNLARIKVTAKEILESIVHVDHEALDEFLIDYKPVDNKGE